MTEASLIAYKGTDYLRLKHRERIEKCLKSLKVPANIVTIGALCGLSKHAVAKRMSEIPNAKIVGTQKDSYSGKTYTMYVWSDEKQNRHKLTANYRKQFRKNFKEVAKQLGEDEGMELFRAFETFEKYNLI